MEATPEPVASRRRIIKRPRLTGILDESGARLILLVAPAGYGKTTLAHEWLDSKRAAWYRGTPASADVAALAVGLANAAAEIVPGAGERMRQRLRAADRPDEDVGILAEMLAEDLEGWPEDAWLVVDDYQYAMDSAASGEFVRVLTELPQLSMLVTSRRRPQWATARRRIYGELEEVDRTMLAMTEDEALSLLQSDDEGTPAFLSSAQGWPALIGLAALSRGQSLAGLSGSASPDEYFAEELYDAASPDLRDRLCDLALAPSPRLIGYLFTGTAGRALLKEGAHLGFLSWNGASYEVHPALREFLGQRSLERPNHAERVRNVGHALLAEGAWHDVFTFVQEHESEELLLELIDQATDPLLAEGRVSTLEQWLNYAAERHLTNEALDYAEAEVAFRSASYTKAEVLATRAATGLGRNHRLTSRAYARAGHSAFLSGSIDTASSLLSKAREAALVKRDVKEALWGQFLCAVERERPEGVSLLGQFEEAVDHDPGDLIRIKAGEILLGVRGLREVTPELLSAIHLADNVNDCLSESSFLNAWMALAIYFGQYGEVLEMASRQRRLIDEFRLDFVLPHLHLREAAAYRGRRRFRDSRTALDRADAAAGGASDSGLTSSLEIARAHVELQQGRPLVALQLLERQPSPLLSPSWTGEYLASRALAFAVAGDASAALEAAESADGSTIAVEARGMSAFARAIVECQAASPRETPAVRRAYAEAVRTYNVDGLVCAYRAYPPLLGQIWHHSEQTEFLVEAIERAGDTSLARTAKIPVAPKRHGAGRLSPRETEILDLLRQGLTNAEIAQTLFVSVSTVKAHVRHIFEKLGVRTRTEAASLELDK